MTRNVTVSSLVVALPVATMGGEIYDYLLKLTSLIK
jgi:hypothetical protein